MRLETANGLTLETELRKLKSYLESRRADWKPEAGEDFAAWATIYAAGALRNLAAGVAVVDTTPRLCSACGKGRPYGDLTLCYSCQTHG